MTDTDQSDTSVRAFVSERAESLQRRYLENESGAVAVLARLRSGIGRPLGESIELVELTIAGFHENPPDSGPTADEQAIYTALTLFALHQQSSRNNRMHRAGGPSLGQAAAQLQQHASPEAVRRRFIALGTATHWDETVTHARGMISQFRAHDIGLDYGRFADDLLWLQKPSSADRVRLRWGRDFFAAGRPATHDDKTKEN